MRARCLLQEAAIAAHERPTDVLWYGTPFVSSSVHEADHYLNMHRVLKFERLAQVSSTCKCLLTCVGC